MSDDNTILGRPITGNVDKSYYTPVEQWDAERLLADLDAVFAADPRIAAINWSQYTPYFNDGDPCEFRCNLNDDALVAYGQVPAYWYYDEALDENDEEVETASTSDFASTRWDSGTRSYVPVENDRIAAAEVANLISNWKHYEHVCREHFGEHSKVVATREGFNVEYYEHD